MNFEVIKKEILFKAVRSSGSGGQNINKVSTKIIIFFNIYKSLGFTESEKERLLDKWKNKISIEGDIIISCSETRSQFKNKEIAVNKLYTLILNDLKIAEKRITTKIPKRVIKKRLDDKKNLSIKKNLRKNFNL